MVVLRVTRKLRASLPESVEPDATSDTALGDWYVNRVTVHRKPLLILISSRSLLPILTPARNVRALPERFPGLVADRLRRLGVSGHLVEAEVAVMTPVHISKSVDRSVLGILVDFAKAVRFELVPGAWSESSLQLAESRLAETPCYAGQSFENVIFPKKKTPDLLMTRWGAG
jgi:hypothetical protein